MADLQAPLTPRREYLHFKDFVLIADILENLEEISLDELELLRRVRRIIENMTSIRKWKEQNGLHES